MTTRIRFRRDTAANWTSANPTLAAGEVGVETDTFKLKTGDGTSDWATLPYVFADDFDGLDTRVDVLEALPIATRCIDDSTDSTGTTALERILSQRTGVGLTTMALSADTIYAVPYEATADELSGNSSLARLRLLVTSGGDHAHIGIWQITSGYPQSLIADSGALAPSGGFISWTPTFTPDPGQLYAVGVLVNASTTVRALSANGCAMLGLDSAFGTAAYTHYRGSVAYGALSDFPTVTMGTSTVPAFGATYS